MKTFFTFLLTIYMMPVALPAQPVITNNEYYHVGDAITMVNCDPSTVNAGSAGAGVFWDFSNVRTSSGLSTTSVLDDTSTVFLTSNLMYILPNGSIEFVKENNTDSYINGLYDTLTHTTNYFNKYDIAQRPMTYNTVDTIGYNNDAPPMHGAGHLTKTGDAYGTLKLPTGTFDNVLRVKKVQEETDTTGTTYITTTTISYLWFDTAHAAPLFRMDSIIGIVGSGQTAMYLEAPAAVKNLSAQPNSFTGYLDNNELLLTGAFENDKVYEVVVYNLIGSRVLTYEFTGSGNAQRFQTEKQLDPGIYIVSVTPKSDPSLRQVVKVVKQ